MPLPSKAEGLQTLEQQKRCEWIHACPHVAEDLHPQLYSKRRRSERLTEFEAMEAFRRIRKRRKLAPREVKFPWKNIESCPLPAGVVPPTRTDDHSGDGGAMTTYPLCSAVH